jgi:photosystem II stability/assembly factor-like uncharacterized protein
MQIETRSFIGLAVLLLVGSTASCTKGDQGGQANKNSASDAAAQKQGHWVAQYQSPAADPNGRLTLFSYNGVAVVSSRVVFVAADKPDPKNPYERVAVVVRTTDGGETWSEISLDQTGLKIPVLNAVSFVSPTQGWAVGADSKGAGVIIGTTDGGATWWGSKSTFKQVPTSVFFVSPEKGWMGGTTSPPGKPDEEGGPSDILTTSDGGKSWSSAYHVPVSINTIKFADENNGWAAGFPAYIYHTADGGRSWQSQRTELEPAEGVPDVNSVAFRRFSFIGIHFPDPQHGWAVARSEDIKEGRLVRTTNGGATWSLLWIAQNLNFRDTFFLSPTEGWVTTEDGQYAYHTVDAGQHWLVEDIKFPQLTPIYRLGGTDPSHVWGAGGGAIFHRVAE